MTGNLLIGVTAVSTSAAVKRKAQRAGKYANYAVSILELRLPLGKREQGHYSPNHPSKAFQIMIRSYYVRSFPGMVPFPRNLFLFDIQLLLNKFSGLFTSFSNARIFRTAIRL